MSEIEDGNPTETFSFVDKRRTAEPLIEDLDPDAVAAETGSAEVKFNAEAEQEEEGSASIYDIAAYCTGMLISECFQRLGLIADPRSGKAVMDLPSARVAIDCVAALVNVLDEPTSTLPDSVRREMKRTLNDLRLNYVDRTRS